MFYVEIEMDGLGRHTVCVHRGWIFTVPIRDTTGGACPRVAGQTHTKQVNCHFGCERLPMHVLSIAFYSIPEKARELEYSLSGIAPKVRGKVGCKQLNVFRNIENHAHVFLQSYWEQRTAMEGFIRSDLFSAILGMKILLTTPPIIKIDHIEKREGMNCISVLRTKGQSPSPDQ